MNSNRIKQPLWATRAQVAGRYGITLSTLHHWVKRGIIPPPAMFGKAPRWQTASLDAFDAQQAARHADPLDA